MYVVYVYILIGMNELLFECYRVPGVVYGVDGLFSFNRGSRLADLDGM